METEPQPEDARSGRVMTGGLEDLAKPDGCGRVALAVIAGTLAFFAFLALGYCFPESHPAVRDLLSWASSGAMAGLVAACLAPRRRWYVAAPLVVALEVVIAGACALLHGMGSYVTPPSVYEGALAGVVLGLVCVCLCGSPARTRRRTGIMMGFTVLGVVWAHVLSRTSENSSLAVIERDIFPSVEKLLSTEVLVRTGPVQWEKPRRMVWSNGVPFVWAHGVMRNPSIGLMFSYGNPHRLSGSPGQLEGLSVDGLEVWVPQPRDFSSDEDYRLDVFRRTLGSMGVRPELASRFWGDTTAGYSSGMSATYHGITYNASPNHYGGAAPAGMTCTVLRCRGTYSASAP